MILDVLILILVYLLYTISRSAVLRGADLLGLKNKRRWKK